MEPERSEDRHESDQQPTERSQPSAKQAAFTPPFAFEGLERVRDSHC
ncbi:hypothetical protein JJE66_33175 [Bradyrhizobium diazoefficiens]|nr:hypothetical protein [Bradyrhizobium diazoefficiens]MBK3666062.1 hypothetical protein [Bradyrhizobium diazoefficiens]